MNAIPTLLTLLLLLRSTAKASPAKIDVQESKNASPFQRIVSGAARGVEMLRSLMDPSRIQSNQDIQPTKMQVLFAGLGRTGTTSLVTAMELLGFRCVHDDTGSAVVDLYGDLDAGKLTLDQVYEKMGERGFNCSFMYTDYGWAAKQEDIKVVLSTRDPEKWVESWLSVTASYRIFTERPFIWLKSIRDSVPLMTRAYKDIPTGGHPEGWEDRDTLLKGYLIHQENVIHSVPEDRLLVYSVKEGWEPLCQLLGVPVPDSPFPHVNDRLKIAAVLATFQVISWIWPLPFLLPVLLVWKLMRRRVAPSKKAKSKAD